MSDDRDETRRFSPFDDATWADEPGRADDAKRPGSGGPDGATRPMPRTPEDPTAVSDATSIMPPAAESPGNPADRAWSGRAEVRAPQPGRTAYQEVEWADGPTTRDRWWMPIVIGVVVLLLLAVLGVGIYLIVRNAGHDQSPGPVTTTSAAPAPSTTAPSTPPSSAPSPTPSTAQPTVAVTIPALVGVALPDAKAALETVGLRARVIYATGDAPPGTVIDSDPKEGQEVPPDTVVTLVVAAPPTVTPTASAAASAGG